MTPPDVVNGDDELFALLLARYSETLTAGGDADPQTDPTLSAELRLRLQRALSCLRRLRRFRIRPRSEDAITRIMDEAVTLRDGLVAGQIGRFRILRTLGHGGGGIVFLAFDPDLRREVALKVPQLPALLAPDMRRRFLREARAAARLDHPNLVPVHEVGEDNGVCYIVSAYCRGGSLSHWLAARTSPVPVRQAAALVAALADAVNYVHDHGIYHRDLKPGNILLDTAGVRRSPELGFEPRLTDFGLAKQMDSDSGQTANGMIVGTPSYMAPEQFECRAAAVDRRTDVYGLGAVLYELLTGRPPFKGATDSETLDQVLFKTPVQPRRLRTEVPRDLETICLKCLEKLSQSRYANAAELAADLRRFLNNEPIQARQARRMERLCKWMRRQPWMTVSVSFACFAVMVLLVGGIWFHRMKRTHDANLAEAEKLHGEREETIRHKEQHLRRYHYADDMAMAARHWSKRRLDELAGQLQSARRQLGPTNADDPRGFEWYYLSAQARILRYRIHSPDFSLLCLAFCPDGKSFATGHEDGAVRLWDRTSGQMLQTLPGHKLPIYSLAYSPNGKYLVSGGGRFTKHSNQGEISLWDMNTLKSRTAFGDPLGAVNSLAFSADGCHLAASLAENTVKVWEAPSGTLRTNLDIGAMPVVFHSNSATLAAGLLDGKIVLRDAADGHEVTSWQGHQSWVLSLAHSQANGVLVSGGKDKVVRVWKQGFDSPLGEYRHDGEVCGVAISPDGLTTASISRDGIVKLYDVSKQRERFWFAIPPDHGRCVAFSPNGKELAVGSQDGNLWMCDVSRMTEAASWLGHRLGPVPREAWTVAFSPDGKTLASAGDDNRIRLWDPINGREDKELPGHQSLVSCIAFSPGGKMLASGSFDKRANVKVWSAVTGAEIATLAGHDQPVYALAFAPDGKTLATAGKDRKTRLWDLVAGKDLQILSSHNIESLAFSSDGRTLALAGDSHALFLWDIKEGKMRETLPPHPKGHVAVAFSPNGQIIATGDTDGVLRFFDAATGRLHQSRQSPGHIVSCLAFSPDGKTLASAGFDKKVKLWQATTGRELLTFPEQKDRVRWLAFSPDGNMLATAGHDGKLTLYRADKTEPRP